MAMDLRSYREDQRAKYEAFGEIVAAIIRSALASASPPHRMQQIQTRAKTVASLAKKLTDRGLDDSDSIEQQIKDLAGCRLIFYSNSDVNRFLESGLVRDNFVVDWDVSKIHHPTSPEPTADELYMGLHYVVSLNPARLSL